MRFPEEVTHETLNRLRRAEGQIRGVQRLLEEGADCKAVIGQISAVQAALHRAALRLMAAGMRECLARSDDDAAANTNGNPGDEAMTIESMENLFLMLR